VSLLRLPNFLSLLAFVIWLLSCLETAIVAFRLFTAHVSKSQGLLQKRAWTTFALSFLDLIFKHATLQFIACALGVGIFITLGWTGVLPYPAFLRVGSMVILAVSLVTELAAICLLTINAQFVRLVKKTQSILTKSDPKTLKALLLSQQITVFVIAFNVILICASCLMLYFTFDTSSKALQVALGVLIDVLLLTSYCGLCIALVVFQLKIVDAPSSSAPIMSPVSAPFQTIQAFPNTSRAVLQGHTDEMI
jgi:hypothetical protein